MYERLFVTFVFAALFGVTLLFLKRRQISAATRASEQLNKQEKLPTIVYFWSDGCPVCKAVQRPALEGVLAEYGRERLALTAYNIDEFPEVAREWGVRTLPTTYLLDSTGTIRHVNNGLVAPENLREQLGPMITHK